MKAMRLPGPAGPRRRGMTMIETVVLMTCVATMLGVCAVLLQLLMRLDADSRARFTGAVAAARLAEQFRRDVHSAHQAAVVVPKEKDGAGTPVLELEAGSERTVRYRSKGAGTVQRMAARKGAGEHREEYELAHAGAVRFVLREDAGQLFAMLEIARAVGVGAGDSPMALEVVALVGKNQDRTSTPAPTTGGKP